jgi:hypothetical protein
VLVNGRDAHFELPISCQSEIEISPPGSLQVRQGSPRESSLAAYVFDERDQRPIAKRYFRHGGIFRIKERCLVPGARYSLAGTCAQNPEPKDGLDRNIIVKGETEGILEVSSNREDEQQSQLLRNAKIAIYSGAALTVVSAAVMLVDIYW